MAADDLGKLTIDRQGGKILPRRRNKPLLWGGVLVGVIILLALFLSGKLSFPVEVETVTVSQIYPSQTFTLLNASGYAVAQRKAAVASKTTGRLEWLGVEEGNRVKTGQILARLENLDVSASRQQAVASLASSRANHDTARASLEQARVELQDATRAYNREKELIRQGIVSQADFDVAEARLNRARAGVAGAESTVAAALAAVKVAEASLTGASVALDYTLIRAPFDGVVLTKNADVGDIVTPIGAAANAKAAVVTIADLASLQVEADVSESNLGKVKAGQSCEIQLDALPDARFRGVIHTIVPTADRSKASVMVKVRFLDNDPRILPEMSAKVAFLERPVAPNEKKPKTGINPAAVLSRDGKKVVFLVKGDRVSEAVVTLGEKIGDLVEVTNGVKAGDKIVVKPLEKMKDGAKIKMAGK